MHRRLETARERNEGARSDLKGQMDRRALMT